MFLPVICGHMPEISEYIERNRKMHEELGYVQPYPSKPIWVGVDPAGVKGDMSVVAYRDPLGSRGYMPAGWVSKDPVYNEDWMSWADPLFNRKLLLVK